jgi:hypothetical protein
VSRGKDNKLLNRFFAPHSTLLLICADLRYLRLVLFFPNPRSSVLIRGKILLFSYNILNAQIPH